MQPDPLRLLPKYCLWLYSPHTRGACSLERKTRNHCTYRRTATVCDQGTKTEVTAAPSLDWCSGRAPLGRLHSSWVLRDGEETQATLWGKELRRQKEETCRKELRRSQCVTWKSGQISLHERNLGFVFLVSISGWLPSLGKQNECKALGSPSYVVPIMPGAVLGTENSRQAPCPHGVSVIATEIGSKKHHHFWEGQCNDFSPFDLDL